MKPLDSISTSIQAKSVQLAHRFTTESGDYINMTLPHFPRCFPPMVDELKCVVCCLHMRVIVSSTLLEWIAYFLVIWHIKLEVQQNIIYLEYKSWRASQVSQKIFPLLRAFLLDCGKQFQCCKPTLFRSQVLVSITMLRSHAQT